MPAHLDDHRNSLDVMAKAGLVPPLRLIVGQGSNTIESEIAVGE